MRKQNGLYSARTIQVPTLKFSLGVAQKVRIQNGIQNIEPIKKMGRTISVTSLSLLPEPIELEPECERGGLSC